jgi:hypothetical protein
VRQPYDRSSTWLIEHHGDGLLAVAQVMARLR